MGEMLHRMIFDPTVLDGFLPSTYSFPRGWRIGAKYYVIFC